MTVLVTGSRGFLAGHLIAELKRRDPRAKLTLLRRKPAPGAEPCDLQDAEAARRVILNHKPDVIYHMAGTTRALDWDGLWGAHVRVTVNLLEAVSRLPDPNATRIVLSGSSAEYGDAPGGRPVTEKAPAAPITLYGSTKLSQTLAALSYRHRGLKVIATRIFNAVGPGMPERLALGAFARQLVAIEKGLQGPTLAVGNLKPRRDFLDARDVARALADLARSGKPGELYNICSGRSVSIEELLKGLIAVSGLNVALKSDLARRRSADASRMIGDCAKLSAATGWKPRISLDESLRATLACYRGR